MVPSRHRFVGAATVLGGLLWTVSPHVVWLVQQRIINAFYLLPLALLFVGMYGIKDPVRQLGVLGAFGYAITFLAMAIVAVGSVLQVAFSPLNSVHFGVDIDQIFFVGFYMLVVAAPFFGIGLWVGEFETVVAPVILMLALPVAALGLVVTNRMALTQFAWMPITVPYGLGWMALGYHFGTGQSIEVARDAGPSEPDQQETPPPADANRE